MTHDNSYGIIQVTRAAITDRRRGNLGMDLEVLSMPKVKSEVQAKAKKADAVKPKESVEIDGHTAKVVAIFTNIDFKASNGGFGHRQGYVISDRKKRAVIVGKTTLRSNFPNAMDEAEPQKFDYAQRGELVKMLSGLEVLNPCEIIAAGSAKTRPTYAKPAG